MTTKYHLDTVLWQLKQVREALERAKSILRDDDCIIEVSYSLLARITYISLDVESTEKWVRRLRDV